MNTASKLHRLWAGIVLFFVGTSLGWSQTTPATGAVAGGAQFGIGLRADGMVWAWGLNTDGQLGDGTAVNRPAPVQIPDLAGVALIAAGDAHAAAIKTDGSLWMWGKNGNGQLGDGTTLQRNAPVPVTALAGVVSVSAGTAHTLAVKTDGTVWAWGLNANGQLGDGTTIQRLSPVQVTGLAGVVAVAAGAFHSLALKADGTVWAWGLNNNGRLGDGTTTQQATPVQVSGLTGIVAVAAGGSHSLALKADGTVWAWGYNANGQLGDNSTTQRLLPVNVPALSGVVSLFAGGSHSAAVKSDGTAWTWGANGNSQLGDGTTSGRKLPVQVPGIVVAVRAGGGASHTFILTADGGVAAFGLAQGGQLGGGASNLQRALPVQISTLSTASDVAAGAAHSFALTSTGAVYAFGLNANGQLGDGTTSSRALPVLLSGVAQVGRLAVGKAHTLALKTDGTVWSWGLNANGQLGDGTTTQRTSPAAVAALTGVQAVAAGIGHSLALKTDGTVLAWGLNTNGQLGDGTTTQRPAPVQVPGLAGVTAIQAGAAFSLALKADGTVWAWGLNANGQLGDGTLTQRLAPVQVVGLTGVTALAAGDAHVLALLSTGAVSAWGNNASGQLGLGNTTQKLVPTAVTALSSVARLAAGTGFSLALKIDGTVWAWGSNTLNELGDGTLIQRTSPVKISVLPAARIAAGASHGLLAATNGTLRGWGLNTNDQLGTTTQARTLVAINLLASAPTDTDRDGLPDSWETTNFGNLSQTGAGDYDRDGLTNIDEYVRGTNPKVVDADGDNLTDLVDVYPADYYNAITPLLALVSGNAQSAAPGQFNAAPFDLAVWDAAGNGPLVNAPVTFQIVSGSGRLATTDVGTPTLNTSLTVRSDADGSVAAYFKHSTVAGTINALSATAGNATLPLSAVTTGADITAPAAPANLSASAITLTSFVLSWSAPADNSGFIASYDIYSGNTLIGTSPTTTFTSIGLAPATVYSMKVKARDAAGNLSGTSAGLSVTTLTDTQLPSKPAGLATSNVQQNSFTLTWTASTDNDLVTGYEVYKDGVLIGTPATPTYTLTGLAPNTQYTMTLRAKDRSGNMSLTSSPFYARSGADITAPSTPAGLTVTNLAGTTLTLTWTASTDNVAVTGYQVFKNDVLLSSPATTTVDITGLTPATAYSFIVKAKDAAGNLSAASAIKPVTTPDTITPSIPAGLTVANLTQTSFTLTWTASTDNVAVTGYQVFKDGVLLSSPTTATLNVSGLAVATTYGFTVKAKDAAGNLSAASAVKSVTTPDTTAPGVPGGLTVTNLAQTSFTLTWTAPTDNVGVTGYQVFKNGVLLSSPTTATLSVTGLTVATTYSFTVKAKDAAGNLSAASAAKSLTTPDTSAPGIPGGLNVANLTQTSFTLTWTAPTDNIAVTGYQVFKNDVLLSSPTTPTVNITGLTPATAYGFTVKARDAAGNFSAASAVKSVTTPDTSAPSTPAGLTVTNLTETSFTLTWTASTDNVAVTSYQVFKNGSLLSSPTTATVDVTGLKAGTTYSFTIKAKDAAGNLSATSAAKTLTAPDMTPPSAPTGLAATNLTLASLTLSWDASTDNIAVTGYNVYQNDIIVGSLNATTRIFKRSGLVSGAKYTYIVKAKDAAGNLSDNSTCIVTVPLAPFSTEGLRVWLKGDAGLPATGPVARWADQSGLGNDAVMTYSENQPVVAAGVINGLPAVRFGDYQDLDLPDIMGAADAGEIIAVLKVTPTTQKVTVLWDFGQETYYYSATPEQSYYQNINDFGVPRVNGVQEPSVPKNLVENYHIHDTAASSALWIQRYNGSPYLTAVGQTIEFGGAPKLGGYFGQFNGDFAEIVVFNRVLSDAERYEVYIYLYNKYGIGGSLGMEDTADNDQDGLTNAQERYIYHTNPYKYDTDGDGISDAIEIRFGLNPLVADAVSDNDGDGVPNNEDARPNDAGIGRLTITVDYPLQGSVIP